jgi:hypothetical protein
MVAIGVAVIPVQIFLYPWLDRTIGQLAIIRWGTLMSAVATPVLPLAAYPLGAAHSAAQVWGCIGVGHVLRYAFTEMCFVANNLISNNAVPQADRGTYVGAQVQQRHYADSSSSITIGLYGSPGVPRFASCDGFLWEES